MRSAALYQPGPAVEAAAWAVWEGCPRCGQGPQPGATALVAYWLEQAPAIARLLRLPDSGFTSMGVFNCRPVRGSVQSLSIHSCGRAADLGVPVSRAGHQVAYRFLQAVAPHAQTLGLQLWIFDRRIWGRSYPAGGGRYEGVHPHRDHHHVELNRQAAARLTLSTLRARVGDWRREADDMSDLVEAIQRSLTAAGHDPGPVDGLWGPRTEAAFVAALRPSAEGGQQFAEDRFRFLDGSARHLLDAGAHPTSLAVMLRRYRDLLAYWRGPAS